MFENKNDNGETHETAILTYHSLDDSGSVVSIAPQDFANQMSGLAGAGLRGISLGEAVAYRRAHNSWPARSVVLTFDDGFTNFYEAAWPVLKRHNFTATLFVVSGHVGGRNDWAPPPAHLGLRALLSWGQITELAASGMEIGSHTRTHPDLRRCSDAEVARELTGSRMEIEDQLSRQVRTFAYPFGAVSAVAQQLAAQEYIASCTTELRSAKSDAPPHLLPRIDAYYLRPAGNFQRFLQRRLSAYLAVRRYGRSVRHALLARGRQR